MDGILMNALHGNLHRLRTELEKLITTRQASFVAGSLFTPKRNNRTQGYVEGATFTRLKDLNPTSRPYIMDRKHIMAEADGLTSGSRSSTKIRKRLLPLGLR